VVVKALADGDRRRSARFVIYGSQTALLEAAHACDIEPFWWSTPAEPGLAASAGTAGVLLIDRDADCPPETGLWRPDDTADGGAASHQYVEDALADAVSHLRSSGRGDELARAAGGPPGSGVGLPIEAVVTGPISKLAWAKAGRKKWAGHTELVAARFGAERARMAFVLPELRVMLATAHVPFTSVVDHLTFGRVAETIEAAHEMCVELGIERPRIAVCGLNPHAGEAGLMGTDESRVITPAVRHAVGQGLDVTGPLPGDTVFNKAVDRVGAIRPVTKFDVVVAMYHDQGLIPVKLLGFDRAVNYTAGLPCPRTSPDHGTAFDIAGRGVANEGSMAAAIDLAVRLARHRAGGVRASTEANAGAEGGRGRR
jgi:4-hydroxythreonine-4-phosphate dehydrogenase